MKVLALIVLSCVLFEAKGYPHNYYPYYYGSNMDTLSVGASDSSKGGMVMSRYYNPYNTPGYGGGMAAFMFKPQEQVNYQAPSQYYTEPKPQVTYTQKTQEINSQGTYGNSPSLKKTEQNSQGIYSGYSPLQKNQEFNPPQSQNSYAPPPQENEVYPQEKLPAIPTEVTELTDFTTEKTEVPTTSKSVIPLVPAAPSAVAPELIETEVEEVDREPRRRVSKKKPVKKPVEEEDEEADEGYPKMPAGAFFPMFFGYGKNQGMGAGGPMAIANAYSTGKGGVASSHATAFGAPRPDYRELKTPDLKKYREVASC